MPNTTRFRLVLPICLIFFANFCAGGLSAGVGGNTQELIMGLERKWADAQSAGDVAAVGELLAKDFFTTNTQGHVLTKKDLLANIKPGHWTDNTLSEMTVKVYGHTAIAAGKWSGKGVMADGSTIDHVERWTDTWIKMPSGKWLCVAGQQTLITKP